MRNRFLLSPLHFPLASRSSLRCSLEATPLSSFPLCAPRARESSLPRERALCSIVSSSSFSLRQVFFPAAELAVPPLSSSLFTRIPSSFAAPGLLLFMAARPDALLDRTPCCARSCAMRFARRRRQRRPCFSPTTASSAPSADRNALLGFRSRSSLSPAPFAVLVQAPAAAPDWLPASRPAAFFTAGCCSLAQLVQSSRTCFPMAAREVFGSSRPGFPGLRALALCPEFPVLLGALPARSGRAAPFVAPRPYPAPARRSPSHGHLPQAAVSSML